MFKFTAKSQDKAGLSLPKSKEVCGYTIKKMPVGAYLDAINRIQGLPGDFLGRCFPGMGLQEIIESVSQADEKMLVELIGGLMATAPEYLVGFIADLAGIPAEKLKEDESIGLDGLMAIIKAFIEVNQLGKTLGEAAGIAKMIKGLLPRGTGLTGSSG